MTQNNAVTERAISNRPCSTSRNASGFTLLEVAVAIAILGLSLTTLIALQTRLMDHFVHERNLFRATLAGQYLMSFHEIENEPPDPNDTTGDLVDALREKGYFDGEKLDQSLENFFRGWKLEEHISSVDYGEFQDILRRIEIRIRWGDAGNESTSLVLFMNTPTTDQSRAGGK